jgi:hypothetical protein
LSSASRRSEASTCRLNISCNRSRGRVLGNRVQYLPLGNSQFPPTQCMCGNPLGLKS